MNKEFIPYMILACLLISFFLHRYFENEDIYSKYLFHKYTSKVVIISIITLLYMFSDNLIYLFIKQADAITIIIVETFYFLSIIFGAVFIQYSFSRIHSLNSANNLVNSKIRSIAIGDIELNAKIKPIKLLNVPYSQTPCVFYRYHIDEYQKDFSKQRPAYMWKRIMQGEERTNFWAVDNTGKIEIFTHNAEFILKPKKNIYHKNENTASQILDSNNTFSSSTYRVGDKRVEETYLEPNENIYILGTAVIDKLHKLSIRKGNPNSQFIISNVREKDTVKVVRKQIIVSFIVGITFFCFGMITLLTQYFN